MRFRLSWVFGMIVAGLVIGIGVFYIYWEYGGSSDSGTYIRRWLIAPEQNMYLKTDALIKCPDAPFVLPSSGFIGLLYRDPARPYSAMRRHTGLDIFGVGESGTVPIYAAYEGYLTRLDTWHSTVIIRHDDPLNPGETIFTYYTHMASRSGDEIFIDAAFPAGTYGVYVEQGTLLGYQGEYNPAFPIAMHVHFSLVKAKDDGSFLNEAILENTIDPSLYFGMIVDYDRTTQRPPRCISDVE